MKSVVWVPPQNKKTNQATIKKEKYMSAIYNHLGYNRKNITKTKTREFWFNN